MYTFPFCVFCGLDHFGCNCFASVEIAVFHGNVVVVCTFFLFRITVIIEEGLNMSSYLEAIGLF